MERYQGEMIPETEIQIPLPIYKADKEAIQAAIVTTDEKAEEIRSGCTNQPNCEAHGNIQLLLDLTRPYIPESSRVLSHHVRCTHGSCPHLNPADPTSS